MTWIITVNIGQIRLTWVVKSKSMADKTDMDFNSEYRAE